MVIQKIPHSWPIRSPKLLQCYKNYTIKNIKYEQISMVNRQSISSSQSRVSMLDMLQSNFLVVNTSKHLSVLDKVSLLIRKYNRRLMNYLRSCTYECHNFRRQFDVDHVDIVVDFKS